MLVRSADRPASDAVVEWIADELPGIEAPFAEALAADPRDVAAVPELQAGNRFRLAVLEDILTGRPSPVTSTRLRAGSRAPRRMASIVVSAMESVWETWYRQPSADSHFDPTEVFADQVPTTSREHFPPQPNWSRRYRSSSATARPAARHRPCAGVPGSAPRPVGSSSAGRARARRLRHRSDAPRPGPEDTCGSIG